MRTPRLFHPQRLHERTAVTLDAGAARYLTKVLRLEPGAPLVLFDGQGGEFEAILSELRKGTVVVAVNRHRTREAESPLQTTLAQGISRGERMDYTLRKATELGVTRIQPLFTEYCQVQLKGERLDKRLRHWEGVVRSACEQSGRNRLPELLEPLPLCDLVARRPDETHLILDPRSENHLQGIDLNGSRVTLIVGPEGGLSPAEIDLLTRHGCIGIRLGPRILRTETAALAALAAMQCLWGDF
ncbi:MAG: 16S rRNA (uracil(1498)-N(3))-methyltransferase [Gammaproteobacteria bacterium]